MATRTPRKGRISEELLDELLAGRDAAEVFRSGELIDDLKKAVAERAAAVGSIVDRLAHPASERATHAWLRERSSLGELLGVDFETMGAMQLYRASDALMKHREAIESHLFGQAMGLFGLTPTITLYDLTASPSGLPSASSGT